MVQAVFFDIGETILDETRSWAAWADWIGVSHLTFFGVMGAVIQRGEHHRRVFELLRPGIDLAREREHMREAGREHRVHAGDLYPDAEPCLAALRGHGYRIGLAGNQPATIEPILRAMGLPVDVVASSGRWGVEKPSPQFFDKLIEVAGVPAREIAYVGDRLDNDVLPAKRAGMVAVFLRRGPWGIVQSGWPEVAQADLRIEGLAEVATSLERFAASREACP